MSWCTCSPLIHAFFSVQLCIDLLKIADILPVHEEGRLGGAEGVGGDLEGAELGSCVQEVERTCYDQGGGSLRNIHPCEQILQCEQQLGQLRIQGLKNIDPWKFLVKKLWKK